MQHNEKLKGQLNSGKIVSESPLTIALNSMPCKHFTSEQRNALAALIRAGIKKKDVARQLRKHRTTVWRERRRGAGSDGRYYVVKSKRLAKSRRIKANARFRKIANDKTLRRYVVRKLKSYWSPEQIAGRWNRRQRRKHIGKDSVYQFVYGKRKDLLKYLRCQKGKYRRRYGTRIREKQREALKKRGIDARPEIVATKQRIGDWEGDTIMGKDKKHILTHTERKSGLVLADKLSSATAEETSMKTTARFKRIPKIKKQTMTYDNGSAFADHELTERATGLCIYFANAYHSWERGCNENANGLLRQFLPKKILFEPITQEEIEKAVGLLNNRPRKRLNFLTPHEVFNQKSECCTLE